MGRFDFKSPGAVAGESFVMRLAQLVAQQDERRRQQQAATLNGIEVQSRVAAMQRAEAAARRQAMLDQQDAEDRARRIAREDAASQTAASTAANEAGYRNMLADRMTQGPLSPQDHAVLASMAVREGRELPDALKPPAPPKRTTVQTVDAQGRPVRRAVTDDELAAGVPEYREPREPREPSYHWVVRNGQPMRVTEGQIRPGDRPYNGAGTGKDATQGQLAADSFYSRAKDALDAIDEVEEGIDAWDLVAPNFMQTGAGQQYHQAKRQFVEAYLRKDSGAAIADSEYANADKTYFPQVGDSAATRRRKRAARERIAESLQHQGSGAVAGSGAGNGASNNGGPRVRRYNPQTGKLE